MDKVKTRFAPSPTGQLHIGGVRTALYSYLWAKKNKGTFILRIEDTDRERFIEGATENIIQALKWLNLNWDEGPIKQSERLDLYKKYAEELLKKGLAFKDEGAIRFKTNKEGSTLWRDLIGDKNISFDNKTQEDFVILKSDGYPTYNFANVVDDHEMQITHVVRGPEFISSTPKHLMLYQALEWEPPKFGHVPMILGTDRSKLSKRHGAKPVLDYQQDGFLPEAILNYMALLGWTPPSGQEILSLEEMIKVFDLKDVHVSPAVFDITKLTWMNGEYIRKLSDEELTKKLQEYLVDHPAKEKIGPVVPLTQERITTLSDFIPLTNFIFEAPEYDKEIFQKIKVDDQKEVLEKILQTMESLPKPWQAENFETAFRKLAGELDVKVGDLFQLIRVAVSGQLVTPPLFESIKIIGEEETLARINRLMASKVV